MIKNDGYRSAKLGWRVVVAVVVMIGTAAMPVRAAEVTLIGEVNDTYQLVANGHVYEVAETPAGDDLVKNYISQRVKVVGTISTEGDVQTITVRAFEPVDE